MVNERARQGDGLSNLPLKCTGASDSFLVRPHHASRINIPSRDIQRIVSFPNLNRSCIPENGSLPANKNNTMVCTYRNTYKAMPGLATLPEECD